MVNEEEKWSFRYSTQPSIISNKKSSSKVSIWRNDGNSSTKGSDVSSTSGSAFAEETLQTAAAETLGTRADLTVGLDIALCGPRETALAVGLDTEADLVVGRGSELIRDAVDSLEAAMDVRGLDGGCDIAGGRMLSAVVFLSGRIVGAAGAGTDNSLVILDRPRTGGGARLHY